MGHNVKKFLAGLFLAGVVMGQVEKDGTLYQIQVEPFYGAQVDRKKGTISGPGVGGTVDKDGDVFILTPKGLQKGQVEKDGTFILLPGLDDQE